MIICLFAHIVLSNFVLFNIFSDDSQLDGDWGMGSNQKETQAFVRKANYGKMKKEM